MVRIPTPPAGTPRPATRTTRKDNKTTAPIVLAPGDVFVNADFGYQPGAVHAARSATRCGSTPTATTPRMPGEPGIPGVTVALIKDLNGDGIWDAGEPIIATDITDENGVYGFIGPAGDDGARRTR